MKNHYGLIPKFTIESFEIIESVPVISGQTMPEELSKYPPLKLFQKIGCYEIPLCYGKTVDVTSGKSINKIMSDKEHSKVPLFQKSIVPIPEVTEYEITDNTLISPEISGIPNIDCFYSNDNEKTPKDSLYIDIQDESQLKLQDDTKFSILPKQIESKEGTVKYEMTKRNTKVESRTDKETFIFEPELKKLDDKMADNYKDFADNYTINPKRSLINPNMEEFLKPVNPSSARNFLDSITPLEETTQKNQNYHS